MKKPGKQQLLLTASCFVSVAVALCNSNGLEGTEFSGGSLTGPLLLMTDIGSVLFALVLISSFLYPRVAGAIGLVSSLLCLPLYLYLIAPVPFNHFFSFGHEFKVQPSGGFHWDRWTIVGALTLAVTIYACFRSLAVTNRSQIPERG
jgi:hypothetical protein